MKVYGSTLLALRGVGWVKFPGGECYVALEWPLMRLRHCKMCFDPR